MVVCMGSSVDAISIECSLCYASGNTLQQSIPHIKVKVHNELHLTHGIHRGMLLPCPLGGSYTPDSKIPCSWMLH